MHRRAVNNWHVARVAAERELTTDMLGTQRRFVLAMRSLLVLGGWIVSGLTFLVLASSCEHGTSIPCGSSGVDQGSLLCPSPDLRLMSARTLLLSCCHTFACPQLPCWTTMPALVLVTLPTRTTVTSAQVPDCSPRCCWSCADTQDL